MNIRNWKRFQHFKNRRPPWIKLYREILDDLQWHELPGDAAKTLVSLWLIASEGAEGQLPDLKTLSFRLRVPEKKLKDTISMLSHWIEQRDIKTISERHQNDLSETETETETEKLTLSSTSVDAPDLSKSTEPKKPTPEALMDFWNDKADPSLSRVREMPTKRREKCAARLKEHPDGVFWKRVLDRINRSAFLLGRRRGSNWKVSFDWIVENQTNALKIAEGQYDDDAGKSNVRGYHERVLGGEGSPAPVREGDGEHQVGDLSELQPGVEQASPVPISRRE